MKASKAKSLRIDSIKNNPSNVFSFISNHRPNNPTPRRHIPLRGVLSFISIPTAQQKLSAARGGDCNFIYHFYFYRLLDFFGRAVGDTLMPAFTLAQNEQIVLMARRHWFFVVIAMIKPLILALVPWLAAFALAFFKLSFINLEMATLLFWYFAWLFWFGCFCWGVFIWVDWYLDLWILTNQKIIDIQQMGLFKRLVMTYVIDNIQGVSVKTRGPLAAFFKYGDAEIKISGQANAVIFCQIPNPQLVQEKIIQVHQEYQKSLASQP